MTDEPDKQMADNRDDGRNEHGQFAEGNTGGPGRPKGKPNKINAVLKDDILQAYQQRGGVEWLKGLKDRDFVGLLEKTMPREVSADLRVATDPRNVKIIVEHVEVPLTGQEKVIDSYVLRAPGQNQHHRSDADGRAEEAPTDAEENT